MNNRIKRDIEVPYSIDDLDEALTKGWHDLYKFSVKAYELAFTGWAALIGITIMKESYWKAGIKRVFRKSYSLPSTHKDIIDTDKDKWEKAKNIEKAFSLSALKQIDKAINNKNLLKKIVSLILNSENVYQIYINLQALFPRKLSKKQINGIKNILESAKTKNEILKIKKELQFIAIGLNDKKKRIETYWSLVALQLQKKMHTITTTASNDKISKSARWWWIGYLISKSRFYIKHDRSDKKTKWWFVISPNHNNIHKQDILGIAIDTAIGLLSVPAFSLAIDIEKSHKSRNVGRKNISVVHELLLTDLENDGCGFTSAKHIITAAEKTGREITGNTIGEKRTTISKAIAELEDAGFEIDRTQGYKLLST